MYKYDTRPSQIIGRDYPLNPTFSMSTLPPIASNEEEIQAPQRPPTPPFHVTFAARGLHVRQLEVLQVTGTFPTSHAYRHKTFPHINLATFEYHLRKQ